MFSKWLMVILAALFLSGCSTGIPEPDRPQPNAEVDDLDRAFLKTDFEFFYSVQDLPREVSDSIGPMANPSEPYNAGCLVVKGLPNRRIINGGVSKEFCFVFFDSGGGLPSVPGRHLMLFQKDGNRFIPKRIYILRGYNQEFPALQYDIQNLYWRLRQDIPPDGTRG